jgi:hypothetical protein
MGSPVQVWLVGAEIRAGNSARAVSPLFFMLSWLESRMCAINHGVSGSSPEGGAEIRAEKQCESGFSAFLFSVG